MPTNTNKTHITPELQQQAWKLRILSWSHDEIAQELGVSLQTVARMLKLMAEQFAQVFEEQLQQMRLEQTAQLQYIAKEAMSAWNQAQQPPVPEEAPPPDAQHLTPARAVSYLKIALQAYAALRALWGLEAAKKVDLSPPQSYTKAYIGMDMDEVKRIHEQPQPGYHPSPQPA